MGAGQRTGRGRRWAAATAGLLLAGLGFAACGSSGSNATKPEGLSGQQAQSYVNAQYSVEDQAAKSVLTPAPGLSWLARPT